MQDDGSGWKQFDKLHFDRKKFSSNVKRASGATNRHAHRYILSRFESVRNARRQIVTWLAILGALIVLVVVQFYLFSGNFFTTSSDGGETYVEGSLGPIDTLNPLYASTPAENTASQLLFSSLYTIDSTGNLGTDVAKNMKISSDTKKYTVTLRDDVYWHDGKKMDVDDVIFTIKLIKDPQARSFLRVNWRDVLVKKVDDRKVEFSLPNIYAAFPHALTFPILPEHLLKNANPGQLRENAFSRSPVGSGPFIFKLLQSSDAIHKQKSIHMTANNKYYLGKPKLDRFEIYAYDKPADIKRGLRIMETSGAQLNSISDALEFESPNYKTVIKPVNSGVYLMLNNKNPVLADKKVRRALQLATNTGEIRKDIDSHIQPLDLPFIDGQLTGDNIPQAPKTDIKEASKLLDKAGWKMSGTVRKKDDQPLTLALTSIKNTQSDKVVDIVRQQWEKIGVDVKLNIIDTTKPDANFFQNVLQPRAYDVLLYELQIGADPDVYAYWHSSQVGSSGYNFANYTSSTADAALISARSRVEPELRNAKYKAFATKWVEEAPAIGLYQQVMIYVTNKHARTIVDDQVLSVESDRLSNVLYWTVDRAMVYKTP